MSHCSTVKLDGVVKRMCKRRPSAVATALSNLRCRRSIHASEMDVLRDPAMMVALSVLLSSSARSEMVAVCLLKRRQAG